MKPPDIVLIGAGHVASHLGRGLHTAGFNVRQVFSRQGTKAQSLAEAINSQPITDLSQAVDDADVYLFSVRDDALEKLAKKIHRPHAIALHTAGAVKGIVLESVSAHFGVFYPLQTFRQELPLDLQEVPICVSGSDERTVLTAKSIALALSNRVEVVEDAQREWLHLAAVVANNHVNYILGQVHHLVEHHGFDYSLLHPLIKRTIGLALEQDPRSIQTGPAKRGDQNTIHRHLELLSEHPELSDMYRYLSNQILDDAQKE